MNGFPYLPSCRAVTISFILEVRYILNHPVVHLAQGQPILWRGQDRLRDQIGVGQIAPGVPSGRAFLRGVPRSFSALVHHIRTEA